MMFLGLRLASLCSYALFFSLSASARPALTLLTTLELCLVPIFQLRWSEPLCILKLNYILKWNLPLSY